MQQILHRGFLGFILFLISVFAFSAYAENTNSPNANQSAPIGLNKLDRVKSPGTDLWRSVRQRDSVITGSTQIKGPNANVLIDTKNNQWREFRKHKLLPYGGIFLMAALGFLLLLLLIVRRKKVPDGRSGKTIRRMSTMQMVTHWFLFVIFAFLATTGLLLLFGRTIIIPLLGAEAFSPIASASKEGHNLMGPLLIIALLMMLIQFLRHNWPAKGDLKWLLTLGGLFSKKHLQVGFFNAGEKTLFWLTIILCTVLSVTGILLLFPYYEVTVNRTQLALVIHAIVALIMIAMVFAHMWMVYTVEGTLDAMNTGEVDENWAKSHHSRWYKETTEKNPSELDSPDLEAKASNEKEGAYS